MNKDSFKIFDSTLSIDLILLQLYLDKKHDEILSNTLEEENLLTDLLVKKYNKLNNAPTKLNKKYNLFKSNDSQIKEMYLALKNLTKDACSYYGYSFDEQDYMVRAWFNYDIKSVNNREYSPIKNERFFHDHLGGFGAPDFHGYYCVNAEPSITYYKIDKDEVFSNVNKNNRMVLCANGFPHGRDDWYEDHARITIAYDVVPFSRLVNLGIENNTNWIKFT